MDASTRSAAGPFRAVWLDAAILAGAIAVSLALLLTIHYLNLCRLHGPALPWGMWSQYLPAFVVLAAVTALTLWILIRRARERQALVNRVVAAHEMIGRVVAFNDQHLAEMDYQRARGAPPLAPVLEAVLLGAAGLSAPRSGMIALPDDDGGLRGELYITSAGQLQRVAAGIEIPPDSRLAITEGREQVRAVNGPERDVGMDDFQQRFHPSVRAAVGTIHNYVTYRVAGQPGGAIIFFNYPAEIGELDQTLVRALGSMIGSVNSVASQLHEREHVQLQSMAKLAELAESRDPETGEHLRRMSHYSALIARAMLKRGLHSDVVDDDYVLDMLHCSPLHDIGKVGIRDEILRKPGRLSEAERTEMQEHAAIGGRVLEGAEYLTMARDIAYYHHERWDGSGYPFGRRGPEIPLCARIVTVADVYDALTSKRVYKEPMTHSQAAEIMHKDSGSQFDPEVLKLFLSLTDEIKAIRDRH